MKTIVVYDSKHGSTRKTAHRLVERLGEGTASLDLSAGGEVDLAPYEAVVLGGPVYAGSWSRRAAKFAQRHEEALAAKRFAAFAAGFDLAQGKAVLAAALPERLASRAVALASLGGAYVFGAMGPLERFIIKAITKSEADSSSVDSAAIDALAASVKGGGR